MGGHVGRGAGGCVSLAESRSTAIPAVMRLAPVPKDDSGRRPASDAVRSTSAKKTVQPGSGQAEAVQAQQLVSEDRTYVVGWSGRA
jgi:hypothetical protein